MEPTKQRKRQFFLALTLILLLIVAGLVMVVRVMGRYEDIILENQDNQLYGLARSVDRSVESYLHQYARDLSYVIHRRGFTAAEESYLSGGGDGDLRFRMGENLLTGSPLTADLLCLNGDEVVLSNSGRTDYRFPPGAGRDGDVEVRPCIGGDETLYLAFVLEGEHGLRYAALMGLGPFYQRVAGDLTAGTQDRIMLLDAGGHTLLHQSPQGIRVDLVAELDESGCDFQGLTFLSRQQSLGAEGTTFYDARSCAAKTPYTARMAVVPATGNNGIFAVGVSINYDNVTRPLRLTAIRLTAYCSMVIAGILLLAGLAVLVGRRNERAHRELALLQEKNAAMEELNRQTQELAHHQRLETIGALTSSIAHEFNNLLTPIMGYSILVLEQTPPDGEAYDSLLEIYNASRKAKDIISRLSDLSRKNTPLTFQYVSPDDLVRRVLAVANPVRPARVEVAVQLDCRHLWLYGNETQLSQLLLNLILNAFQAMEPEGGRLTLTTAAPDGDVVLSVSDTGPGIPPVVLPHIFEPFFTTKDRGKGTGLGLAIVQQVVEEHHGTIAVDTAPDRGTTITVTFPTAPREEEEGKAPT